MKRIFTLLLLSLLFVTPFARAEGPEDQYVEIYNQIQQGDTLTEKGQIPLAIAKYRETEVALRRFQTSYPDWNQKVVNFRLRYLANKVADLSSRPQAVAPATNAPVVNPATNVPPAPPENTPVVTPTVEPSAPEKSAPAPSPTAALEDQIRNLQERIGGLEGDRSLLQAKLKEALSAQPAAVDPQELLKAQSQIKELQKENEMLKLVSDQSRTNVSPAVSADVEKLKQELAQARTNISELRDANAKFELNNHALQARNDTFLKQEAADQAMRDENAILKKQLADLQGKSASAPQAEQLSQQLKQAQAQLATLQSDKEVLRLEKTVLENRVKEMSAAPATVATNNSSTPLLDGVTAGKIAQLEAQRDELQKSLNAATREIYGRRKGKETAARIEEMSGQLAALRARIEVYEAKQVPYSTEELALLSKPDANLMASVSVGKRKAPRTLPAGASALLAEAKKYFMAHDLEKAEAKYNEIVKLDEKNATALADLASIQLELGHTADAEQSIKKAFAVDPNDDYVLFIMGQMRFQQKNYDQAFDMLSRAALVNPQNARIQNFLGLTLSEKGLRSPAETAFRKAIQIDPGFADAHVNLAVVYVTQQPPLTELARWHYQKALASGMQPNPNVERLLDASKTQPGTR